MTAGVVRVSNSLLPAGSLDGNASSGAFGTSSSLRGMVVDILCERERMVPTILRLGRNIVLGRRGGLFHSQRLSLARVHRGRRAMPSCSHSVRGFPSERAWPFLPKMCRDDMTASLLHLFILPYNGLCRCVASGRASASSPCFIHRICLLPRPCSSLTPSSTR